MGYKKSPSTGYAHSADAGYNPSPSTGYAGKPHGNAYTPSPSSLAALVASAGVDATLVYNTATALGGSATGGVAPYTYAWTIDSHPEDGELVFADATSATSNATLTGPNGAFVARLTVTDAALNTASDTVTLTLNAALAAISGTPLYNWDAHTPSNGAVGAAGSWPSIGSDTTELLQATAGKQPQRAATSFNGAYPGVTSDGGDVLLATLGTAIASGTRPYMFAVAQVDVTATNGNIALLMTNDEASSMIELYNGAGEASVKEYTHWRVDSSGAGVESNSFFSNTSPRVFETGFTVSGLRSCVIDGAWRNNTRTGTPTANITKLRLFGYDATPTFAGKNTIAQVLVYATEPSETDKAAIRALLRSTWGIAASLYSKSRVIDLRDVDADLDGTINNGSGDAATDGTYVYFPPGWAAPAKKIARYDATKNFLDTTSWAVKAIPVAGSWGGGGCAYLAPYLYITTDGTKFIRVDVRDFSADASYTSFDLAGVSGSGTATNYEYPFTDGVRYVYLPHLDFSQATGIHMIRYDSQASFTAAGSYVASMDTTTISALCKGYMGGCVLPDGRVLFNAHQYSATMHGNQILWDPNAGAFSSVAAWSTFNTASINADMIGMSSAFMGDGNYVYFTHGEVSQGASDGYLLQRWNSALSFTNPAAWETFDIFANVSTIAHGFTKGFYDSRYVVMPNEAHNHVVLYDTQGAGFTNAASYQTMHVRAWADGTTPRFQAGGVALNGSRYIAPTLSPYVMKIGP